LRQSSERRGALGTDETLLFWHTGDAAGLSGKVAELMSED